MTKRVYIASSTRWGGSNIALYHLVSELYKESEIHVVMPDKKGRFYEEMSKLEGVHTHSFKYYLTAYSTKKNPLRRLAHIIIHLIIINGFAKYRLKCLLRKINPELVHNNVGPLDISSKVCKNLGINHIWHIREYQDLDFNIDFFPSFDEFKNRIHESNNHCIAITKGIFEHFNLRPKDKVIYDGVLKEGSNLDLQKEKCKYFLLAGRIEKAKGIKTAIKAFSEFNKINNNYELWLAGACLRGYDVECKELTRELDIVDKVKFLGERSDIAKLMNEAKALIMASEFEGFGLVTAEAMFNRCLVIGKNTAGTKEQFDRGLELTGDEIGFRFSSEDELTQAMLKVVNRDDWSDIIQRAYEVVSANYTTLAHKKAILNFYKEIIS